VLWARSKNNLRKWKSHIDVRSLQLTNVISDFRYLLLSGEIPHDIGLLTSLTKLWLISNLFTGEIPSLPLSLEILYLDNNRLTGEIMSLSGLTSLTHLILSNNQLNGTIPDLRNFTALRYLRIENNQLSGNLRLSSEITNLLSCHVLPNLEICREESSTICGTEIPGKILYTFYA
jgi:Leucine-rich repeat (LRR) protein